MTDEYFFALTLKGKSSEVWDPETKDSDDYQGGHKLIIKQALLGPEAAAGEINVIQVETMTLKDAVKIPIAVLKAGGPNNQVPLDVSFPDPPVTFSLAQGNGPVHIIGHHLVGGTGEEFDDMDEMEEEMLDEEEEDGLEEEMKKEEPKPKKAKTVNNAKGKGTAKNNTKTKK